MCSIFIFEERFSPSAKPSVDVSLLQRHIAEQLEIVAIPPSDVAETQVIIFLKPYWL